MYRWCRIEPFCDKGVAHIRNAKSYESGYVIIGMAFVIGLHRPGHGSDFLVE